MTRKTLFKTITIGVKTIAMGRETKLNRGGLEGLPDLQGDELNKLTCRNNGDVSIQTCLVPITTLGKAEHWVVNV